jgi:virginiamycin B lyase
LGPGSAPHGVIVGPDGAPWITDGGQNAIVRVDPKTRAVRKWPLPRDTGYTNLNTLTFDRKGRVWFTGQSGFYGRLDIAANDVKVWKAPGGRGPYGIATTPGGDVYYASLAGNHIARIDTETGEAKVIEPPTKEQGARRVWSDSRGRIWVSYWNTGHVGLYDPTTQGWREWKLPGNAHTYSVWVDDKDKVWLTDWSANAIVKFDPVTEKFESFPSTRANADVRQMLGRSGEAWGAESDVDRLVMVPAQ